MNSRINISLFGLLAIMFCVDGLRAQDDIEQILEAGIENANVLADGYVSPFTKGLGSGLGSGWYNTAKAHKPLGFDLTITANNAFIPDGDLMYDPSNVSGTSTLQLLDESAPTIFGREERPSYSYSYEGEDGNLVTGNFEGPESLIDVKEDIPIQAVPVPMVNLGIGIVKKTDLKIRWTPEIEVDDAKFKMIGFALMHDIKQYIPGLKLAPFDMSVLIGFTDITTSYGLAEGTDDEYGPNEIYVGTDDGVANFDINTWTFQGLVSKKFGVITFYGGVGYNVVKSELDLNGTYYLKEGEEILEDLGEDPIDIDFKENGARLTGGFRLKLAIITLHADYTVQKYDVLTVGLGFSVR